MQPASGKILALGTHAAIGRTADCDCDIAMSGLSERQGWGESGPNGQRPCTHRNAADVSTGRARLSAIAVSAVTGLRHRGRPQLERQSAYFFG